MYRGVDFPVHYLDLIQIDTTNILFIVGGAFSGLEGIVESRIGKKTLGFGATLPTKEERDLDTIFSEVMPEDLLKFGLIPEFIGRLPVITSVHNLDREALLQILMEPRNALVKQYQRLFEMEGAELDFEPGALAEIAKLAKARDTGARGLRSIVENIMLDVMYELPDMDSKGKHVVTADIVRGLRKLFAGPPEVILEKPIDKMSA